MEIFKVEHFNKNNSSEQFPSYSSLNKMEQNIAFLKLKELIKVEDVDTLTLTKRICELQNDLDGIDASAENFSLNSVFDKLKIQPNEDVFLNWYRYDDIDKIKFSDLNKYFSDIWYPSSDDIDIFDSTFSWIVSVCHDGRIKYIRKEGW